MIEFACQHCGNVMKADDHYSGRSACCQTCRRFIILPQADGGGGNVFLLFLEECCKRMENVLGSLAESAQRTETLLAQYRSAQATPRAKQTLPSHVECLSEAEEDLSNVRDLQHQLERALTECEARRVVARALKPQLRDRYTIFPNR